MLIIRSSPKKKPSIVIFFSFHLWLRAFSQAYLYLQCVQQQQQQSQPRFLFHLVLAGVVEAVAHELPSLLLVRDGK